MAAGASAYADEDDDRLITEINVTPLVDIVLVLLIVFMITIPMIMALGSMQESELDIALPEASELAPLTTKRQELVVNVDANGRFIMSHVPQSEAELEQAFNEAQNAAPGKTSLLIRIDKRCPSQYLFTVINLCHKAKIRDYFVSSIEQ